MAQESNEAAPGPAAPGMTPKATEMAPAASDGDDVRALTMHEMVESHKTGSISNHVVKLLMMTGRQARLVCDSPGAIKRMIAALGIRLGTGDKHSQLVINLLESGGFQDYTTKVIQQERMWTLNQRWAPGMVHGRAPFCSEDDERKAHRQIDLFMADVLIPLAAQTRAVVICNALKGACVLSESFMRMHRLASRQWPEPPFFVLSTTCDIIGIYCSPELSTRPKDPEKLKSFKRDRHWKRIREASKTWKKRDENIEQGIRNAYSGKDPPKLDWDLDPNASNYLIVDEGSDVYNRGCYLDLVALLTTTLASRLPSIAIQTGFSQKRPLSGKFFSSIGMAVDIAMSGCPVLFLDVRDRSEKNSPHKQNNMPRDQHENDTPSSGGREIDRPRSVGSEGVVTSPSAVITSPMARSPPRVAPLTRVAPSLPAPPIRTSPLTSLQVSAPEHPSVPSTPTDRNKWSEAGQRALEQQGSGTPLLRSSSLRSLLTKAMWPLAPSQVTPTEDSADDQAGETKDRKGIIDRAKQSYEAHCKMLRQKNVMETFDCAVLAYFHEALFGDGDTSTAELNHGRKAISNDESKQKPLYEAIACFEREAQLSGHKTHTNKVNGSMQMSVATNTQVRDLVSWLAGHHFKQAWEMLLEQKEFQKALEDPKVAPDQEIRRNLELIRKWCDEGCNEGKGAQRAPPKLYLEACKAAQGPPPKLYLEARNAFESLASQLLSSQDFYHLNIASDSLIDLGKDLVKQLVKLDRLPPENTLEGCKLLKDAWIDYDIAMLLALRNKRRCKILFVLKLLCGWAAVATSAVSQYLRQSIFMANESFVNVSAMLVQVAFTLSILVTVLMGFDSLLKAKSKWRQLRRTANGIESVIWKYRTRTGEFEPPAHHTNDEQPNRKLERALRELRGELISTHSLTTADFAKDQPPHVYKHGQFCPSNTTVNWALFRRAMREKSFANLIQFDDNGDKKLSKEELLEMAKECNVESELSGEKLKQLMSDPKWCKNSEWITFDEFQKMLEHSSLFAQEEERRRYDWCMKAFRKGLKVLDIDDDSIKDDYQSPVQPARYIDLRIKTQIARYQRRIPSNTFGSFFFRSLMIILGTTASMCAHYGIVWCVVVVTAATGNLGTWMEFSDYEHKAERYSRAVGELKKLLSWWASLTEIEQAALSNIATLVGEAESIIAEEQSRPVGAREDKVKKASSDLDSKETDDSLLFLMPMEG